MSTQPQHAWSGAVLQWAVTLIAHVGSRHPSEPVMYNHAQTEAGFALNRATQRIINTWQIPRAAMSQLAMHVARFQLRKLAKRISGKKKRDHRDIGTVVSQCLEIVYTARQQAAPQPPCHSPSVRKGLNVKAGTEHDVKAVMSNPD